MSALPSGTSELDTVVLRLLDAGVEVRGWSQYQFTRGFLTPAAAWSFRMAADDAALVPQLVEGARAQLCINGLPQCTGRIDKRTTEGSSAAGTTVTVQGRDRLGPVVDATVDPVFQFSSGMTVPQFVLALLGPFGITTIYNADYYNLSVVSGWGGYAGKGGTTTTVQGATPHVATDEATGKATLTLAASAGKLVQVSTRPDLTTLQLSAAKPHLGEGVWAYINRILSRLGLTLWATADGTAVVIDQPDFASPPGWQLTHKRSDPSQNNVEWGAVSTDLSTQPSCIVAFGFGSNGDAKKSRLKCIAVNELVGLDATGQILPSVQAIIARYKGALVLPIRGAPLPLAKAQGDPGICVPLFLKDDEAQTMAQLKAFTQRQLATWQCKALAASYEVLGHTPGGRPWAVNGSVAVTDEVRSVRETLWVKDLTFTKSVKGGTKARLELIRPFTLQLGT